MFSNTLRLKKHSSASCNKTSLHINQSPNKSRLWITDYWLQKSCWSTLMETINRVVNCCSWGMKGRKLLRWRESNESRVVPLFALGEFGRFRDGRQTRKCLSPMGCLLMVEAVRMWWVTMVHGGWRWIRGYFIHVLVLSFLCSSHSFHARTRPLFHFLSDGNQCWHHLPLGPGCPGCPGSPGIPASPGSPRKPGVPT